MDHSEVMMVRGVLRSGGKMRIRMSGGGGSPDGLMSKVVR